MNVEHKQINCREIGIDELLAPLMIKLWDRNIETLYSCQGDPDRKCDAYISFKSISDAIKFLDLTFVPDPIELQIVYEDGTKEFVDRTELMLKQHVPHIRSIVRFQTMNIESMTRNIN